MPLHQVVLRHRGREVQIAALALVQDDASLQARVEKIFAVPAEEQILHRGLGYVDVHRKMRVADLRYTAKQQPSNTAHKAAQSFRQPVRDEQLIERNKF